MHPATPLVELEDLLISTLPAGWLVRRLDPWRLLNLMQPESRLVEKMLILLEGGVEQSIEPSLVFATIAFDRDCWI